MFLSCLSFVGSSTVLIWSMCTVSFAVDSLDAYIERFNRTYRHEVLNAYVFESLRQVREITQAWIIEYNEERPHDSLGKIPPAMFRRQVENARISTSELCH